MRTPPMVVEGPAITSPITSVHPDEWRALMRRAAAHGASWGLVGG